MFEKSSKYYDLFYEFKDYRKEAEFIKGYLDSINPNIKSVLDVACGTGEHDKYLKHYYEVNGLDLNREFIKIAQSKNPELSYFCSDMTHIALNKKYDAVVCLFSSIGYLKTLDRVEQAIACFRDHLSHDGVILVEPWYPPDKWSPGYIHMLTFDQRGTKGCRMSISDAAGNLTFDYLIGTSEGLEHFVERHEMGLFTVEQMTLAFEKANLSVEYDDVSFPDRGMFVARKR